MAPLVIFGYVLLYAPWVGTAVILALLLGGGCVLLRKQRMALFRG
ncbi:hypothetical protein D3OALGB2SA_804 [Olavius algarvensis associated proteobacterium Delta 3]|nr:hypothetical protein D3OALGB2SA_804 [Olavius algarvensis associated proteobacterium Delta 3]